MFNIFRRRVREHVFQPPSACDEPWQGEDESVAVGPLPRMLVLVKPRQPFVTWVRKTVGVSDFTLAQALQDDLRSYLIPTHDWDGEGADVFVETYWPHFFAQHLSDWMLDSSRWPAGRSLALFRDWFEVTVCDSVLDLGGYRE